MFFSGRIVPRTPTSLPSSNAFALSFITGSGVSIPNSDHVPELRNAHDPSPAGTAATPMPYRESQAGPHTHHSRPSLPPLPVEEAPATPLRPVCPQACGRQPHRIEQRIRPVPFSNVIELACAGKRPLGRHHARQPIVDEVWDEQQVRCLRQPLRWLGEKLVKAIHLHELNTRLLVQEVLSEPLYDGVLDPRRS